MYILGLFIFTTWSASLNVLQNAITKSLPLIGNDESHLKHLLLGRLADSIATDAKTREQVFNLTNINGEVTVWLRLNESCLKKLETFLTGVTKFNKQLTVDYPAMSAIPRPFVKQSAPLLFSRSAPMENHTDQETFRSTLHHLAIRASSSCARLPFLRYLLQDFWRDKPGGGYMAHRRRVSPNWTIKDRLGIVQRSLGRIMSTIDESLEAMELHFKLVGLASFRLESQCQIPSAKTPEKENDMTVNAYRYASDVNLPWRIYATLRWAMVSCVRRFGDHLRAIQMDAKRKRRIQHLWETIAMPDDGC
ncbi:hypothetical protein TcWFU_005147 [Taenia crassiceps]|uniref:Uncharacterized protein n=1 Tax=Taenia crassiceps TaxID=6207 RepID=A0ABR4QDP8_9CEST